MYDKIAPFYDLTHADLRDDIEFVLELVRQADGPILELGCGTGRLLLPIAQAGKPVTGVDNSAPMLARARQNLATAPEALRQLVTLVEGNMATLALKERQFGLAIFSHNTFMHLESDLMLRTLKRIRLHLRPAGTLFIDLINPFRVAQTPNDRMLTLERHIVDPESGNMVLQMASSYVEEMSQRLLITWIYDLIPIHGGPVHRTLSEGVYHYRYPHQLELMLSEAGFKQESLAGDYDNGSFDEQSDRLLLLARVD